jgi:hypothetical protein
MKTLTGQLLKGNLEALKLELGVGTPVFVTDFRRYGTLATSLNRCRLYIIIHTGVDTRRYLRRSNCDLSQL